MVAACAEKDAPKISAVTIGRSHLGVMGGSLLEASRDVFGMLFVALENLQAVCSRLFSSALLADGISCVSSALSTAL